MNILNRWFAGLNLVFDGVDIGVCLQYEAAQHLNRGVVQCLSQETGS